jgi:hypothetical protein
MNIQDTIERAFKAAGLDTRSGTLRGVTDTIRRALASAGLGDERAQPAADDAIDVEAREVHSPEADAAEVGAAEVDAPGQFVRHTHKAAVGSRDYKLYIPARRPQHSKAMPLVVMLHG